jgi:VIT1/CCC1 family predicted Fe2+/Mn2+ transporter
MPTTPHVEKHFTATAVVRDIVIGMSDGLTVPFALAAGLSGVVASTGVVVTAGLAEIAAGSIAMGLGGFLASRTDAQHYESELRREIEEVETRPDDERAEVREILITYGLTPEQAIPVIVALSADKKRWVDFMMRFELGLEPVEPARARNSALTIAASYIAGGLVPLGPYMLLKNANHALLVSVGFTLVALIAFGAIKARFTGVSSIKGATQTAIVGGLAAGAAFVIAKVIS